MHLQVIWPSTFQLNHAHQPLFSLPMLTATPQSPPRKHLSDASTQADRGPGATAFRTSGVARTRRLSGNPAAAVVSAAVGARDNPGAPGDVSVGRAVAAAAVVGAATAALTAFDDRRLAVCFLRWARDTDRAKAATAAAAAAAALAAAREEAHREREAWEALQATLEGSASAREREAKEAAEEEGRKVGNVVGALVLAEEG